MAFLGMEYKANELPESQSFEPLPPGPYNLKITEATLKDTNSGTGQYIAIRLDVTGPTNVGRVIFDNLNIRNPSSKAEEIARQKLGELMRAIGLAAVSDTDQLVNRDVAAMVKTEKSDEYGDKSIISHYKAIGGSAMPTTEAKAPAAGAKAPAAGAKAPWMK